ncbi:MAG TPA: sulfatase [Gaiellales bacterium]
MRSRLAIRLIVAVAITIGAVAIVAAIVVVAVDRAAAGPSSPHHRNHLHNQNGPAPPPPPAGSKHPNIVLILTDDQRFDTLWSMPNVKKLLVDHGVTFTNAFVTNSFCCPSRSTILTGNYSHTTGIYGNRPPHGGAVDFHRYGDDRSTIAIWLRDAGYHTGLVGKYLNGYHGRFIPPGWDTWDAFNWGYHYYGFQLYQNDHPAACHGAFKCAVTYPKTAYSTNVLTGMATKFIHTAPKNRPFFLYFAPYAPHLPATPEYRYRTRYRHLPLFRPADFNKVTASQPAWLKALPRLKQKGIDFVGTFRRHQYESLISVDNGVKRVVAALKARGALHDTMIVFASDNGLEWGQHGFPAAEKRTPYDESIRIPMVVRYDPLTTKAKRDNHLILNTDWAPTWATLAHAEHPKTEGLDFLPLLRPGDAKVPWRTSFLLENWDGSPPTPDPTYCGLRAQHYLYVEYQGGSQELYDLRRDPGELHNLVTVPAYHKVLARLHAQTLHDCHPPPPGFHPY